MTRVIRALACAALMGLAAVPAGAIKAPPGAAKDAERFSSPPVPQAGAPAAAVRRFSSFNQRHGGGWKIRFDGRTGSASALVDGRAPAPPGAPPQSAQSFLNENFDLLGIDPRTLVVERQNEVDGHKHVLFRQTYRGLPVEFARVKVHFSDRGEVLGVNSAYQPGLDLSIVPSVPEQAAADVVLRDSGLPVLPDGRLVVYPASAGARLAWKFTTRGKQALWRYYIDAQTGELLFRFNDLRFQTPPVCLTSGTIMGMVYEVDPSTTPGPVPRPFNNQKVYVVDGSTFAVTSGAPTYGQGFFCSGTKGKIITSLQGPFVNAGNFRGPNAHYDNGSGVWSTLATPISSPHPYPNNVILVSTINIAASAPLAVKVLPVFNNFNVGRFDSSLQDGGDVTDSDQVAVLDGDGNPVSFYIGNRGSFNGAAVHGQLLRLRLSSNDQGTNFGFDVSLSSFLTISNPTSYGVDGSSLIWKPENTHVGLRGEINLFYHLNKMHDYFVSDVNRSSIASISNRPLAAMAHAGPDLNNAFYDPVYDGLMFGDISNLAPTDALTDDATVPRHEYTHYVIEKIWPIQNFGQAGAISEAIADYFSASSLEHSAIGTFYLQSIGVGGALRELDCQANPPCKSLNGNTDWKGEIHDDSIFLSQALWDIRRDRITALGPAVGRSCVDNLTFQSLLFFPESFTEMLDAMKRVDSSGIVAACGGANAVQSVINAKFALHGLQLASGDAFEGSRGNNGFETAIDISTFPSLNATVSPAGDLDFYTFGAGPGPLQITLTLPVDGPFRKVYTLTLYDRDHKQVAYAQPPLDGQQTLFEGAACEQSDCLTTASKVVLTYNNPAATQLFLQIAGGPTVGGSNSGVNSSLPYLLETTYTKPAALSGGIVSAKFDNDRISFRVNVTSHPQIQDYRFAYAQLRDHSLSVLGNTLTHVPAQAGDYLTMVSSESALGRITGEVALVPGFAARFPAVGTIHVEVFGYNVAGSTVSLGLSNPLNLTTTKTELKAFNNVFNPARGDKTTAKFDVQTTGRVTIKLYTMNGTLVATLFDGEAPAGKGSVDWSGRNLSGSVVASGIYLLHMEGPGISKTQKIAIVK